MGARTPGPVARFPVASPSSLVGRDGDLQSLRELMNAHRLVTVTGPGGVGKTSLALTAALLSSEQTGVVVCELADLESPEAVPHAVAASLGGALRSGEPVGARLPGAKDGAGHLVVLDNCEHVADAAAEVAEQLLTAGPRVRVLATSREPLRLPGEQVMVLAPLPVPDSPDDQDAAAAPAVVLFTRRARQADPGFELDDDTLPDVVHLCRRLDGVPLALEIAAARVRVLGVRGIADRLSRRFALLRSGARHAPDRHRSLRAVVDWSYDLLEPQERDLFTALSVYPSGVDLATVAATGAALGIDADEVVDVLDGLVAKSLVTVTASRPGVRYGMLETLREYGLERLEQAGALHRARDRHADHCAALARTVRAGMIRAWTTDGALLLTELVGFRAALVWTLEHDATADRSFDLLAPLWYAALQVNAGEIAELADRALHRWPERAHPRWSEVAGTAAAARSTLEEYAAARRLGQAAAAATASSPVGVAFGYCELAQVALLDDDDPDLALAYVDRADEAAAAAGFEPLRCDLMGRRAQMLAQAGRTDEALATAQRAHALARAQGNAFELAWSQHLVGLLLIPTQADAASEWLTRALAESRGLQYPYGTNSSLRGLALASSVRGDLGTAAMLFSEALAGFTRAGHLGQRWSTVAAAVSLLVAAGRRESAAVLLAGLDSSGVVVMRVHAPLLDDVRGRLTAELRTAHLAARGRAMSPEQLLALARSELRHLRRTARPADPAEPAEPTEPAEPAEPAESIEPTGETGEPVAELCHEGNLWRAGFAGTTVHLPDLRGVRDLAYLLARPEREVAALDLATGADPQQRGAGAQADRDGGLGVPGDLGERLDARARAEYAARIRELQTELDEAGSAGDGERDVRAQQELDFLTRELSSAYGLGGPRRVGDPAERARSTVTVRIRSAIAKIGDAHPALGRHLDASIRTGRFCSYRPERPTTWQVTL